MRGVVSKIHSGLAWVIFAAVVAQFFFAGLGIFGASNLQLHRTTGSLVIPASFILLVLSLAGWLGRARIGLSALLLVLTIVQSMLPRGPSLVAALHLLNAVAILFAAWALARGRMAVGVPSRPVERVASM